MRFLESAWYNKAPWLWLLSPISLLFLLVVKIRALRVTASPTAENTIPVIVVGNITVGGTGKTPLIIALCNHLKQLGMTPGVISRGYGGNANSYPMDVDSDSNPALAGDEPVLIALKTGCPVVVDPDRVSALNHLLIDQEVDVVLSDDGLQHYRLHRDIEIAVVDGQRYFGNGLLLPAGPLREPVSRLRECDFVVINQAVDQASSPTKAGVPDSAVDMHLKAVALTNLSTGEKRPFSGAPFNIGNQIQAVAAIGNPQRFFDSLTALPYPFVAHPFPDHHQFQPSDFDCFDSRQPIVMTEKDGIKCQDFASANMWCVEIDVSLPEPLLSGIEAKLKR
jgi:tetraacyldisaccharide 4'-kinase